MMLYDEYFFDGEPSNTLSSTYSLAAATRRLEAFLKAMREDSIEVLVEASSFLSPELEERLREILSPPDYEAEEDDSYLPSLQVESTRQFLLFCYRSGHMLDERFLPGRDYHGEIGLQLLHSKRGILAINFRADGDTILAWRNDNGRYGSCRCPANDLLTEIDPIMIEKWLER